ncbi:ATP-binding protein [Christensenella tenuis]|uniref:histidine kinase n=1 Tax=Christensenella tenuis TaxID=2763033 RepID=A0ABR7EDC7_9FIRM|nr:ATP-binding protein [Christensenella tenuis]MBC5647034.1 ATP-binding protein [Christensenella tenuis]
MKEIALHIMDIVQNSITANATLIEVFLSVVRRDNTISVTIKDNGKGMSREMLAHVTSPFVTTRTTRKVGLGISLFKAGAESSGGNFSIDSEEGKGTELTAVYVLDNIDRPPIGDFAGTMHSLIVCNPDLDFLIQVTIDGHEETLDTREVRQVLGEDVPLDLPDVSAWLKENLDEIFPTEYAMF